MFGLFWSALSWLGIINNKHARLLFLGLDNAGKTTLLHMLKDNRLALHEPTRFPHDEEIIIGHVRFKAHDVGGHLAVRRLWRQYVSAVDAVIFLIDSTDHRRFGEAKHELNKLLTDTSLHRHCPFLILGTKTDKLHAVSEQQLRAALGITRTSGQSMDHQAGDDDGVHPLEVFMCSVVKRAGYEAGFKWLTQYLK